MAISADTTALVAAQLTVAWSNLYVAKQGVGGLENSEMQGQIAVVYDRFRKAVAEVELAAPGYDMRKLLG